MIGRQKTTPFRLGGGELSPPVDLAGGLVATCLNSREDLTASGAYEALQSGSLNFAL